MKSKSIPNPHARKILATTRVNANEMKSALWKAQVYFEGNLSVFIREAMKAYNPKNKK